MSTPNATPTMTLPRISEAQVEQDIALFRHGAITYTARDAEGEHVTGSLVYLCEGQDTPNYTLSLSALAKALEGITSEQIANFFASDCHHYADLVVMNQVPGVLIEVCKDGFDPNISLTTPDVMDVLGPELAHVATELADLPVAILVADPEASRWRAPAIWAFIPATAVNPSLLTKIAGVIDSLLNGVSDINTINHRV